MPKVSVIVPVYNTGNYLKQCLDSLIKQTLSDLEIVCINDGSTDNSLDILNQYAHKNKHIKIIDLKENKGVSVARNFGINAANGDYIAFVDSDDYVDLDFYQKLYAKAKETNADIVKGDLKEILITGQTITYQQNEDILKYQNKFCFYLSFTSAIYKLNLVKSKKCFFDHRLVHTEDLVWLNHIVSAANTVQVVPDTFYYYIRRNNSSDTQILSEKNAYSAYVGLKHIFLNIRNFSLNSNLDFSLCYQKYFQGILSFIFRSPNFKCRFLFCKLLFYFYHSCPDFYSQYLIKKIPQLYPFFSNNKLEELADSMKDKNSYADFIFASLRHNIQQRQLKNMPKVSIIIPVYNVQNYIKKCLDSICHQTYQNIEIICVDDCSTDNSVNILKQYAEKDKRIVIIQRNENGGQAAARQTGIDAATGDYIGFIDSDDWVDNDYYEKMVEKAEHDRTDIVVNGNILVHEHEKIYPKIFPGHKLLQEKIYTNPADLIDKIFCVVWNKLFRSAFLKQKKYTIPNRSAHEDLFFHYATFAFAKNISFFNGSAYHYLFREDSISNLKHDRGMEHIKVFSQIYDFYEKNDLLNKKIKLYATMPFFIIKSEEMFIEYKKYFTKVIDHLNEKKDIFNALDLFFANSVCECKDYTDYASKYPASPLISFSRRKK